MFEGIKATARKAKESREQKSAEDRARREEKERRKAENEALKAAKRKLELASMQQRNLSVQEKLRLDKSLLAAKRERARLADEAFMQSPVVRGTTAGTKATKKAASGLYRWTKKATKDSRPGWYKRKGYNTLIGDFGEPTPRKKVMHYHQQTDAGRVSWAYHTHADGGSRHQHSKLGLTGYSKTKPVLQRSRGRVIIIR